MFTHESRTGHSTMWLSSIIPAIILVALGWDELGHADPAWSDGDSTAGGGGAAADTRPRSMA
jgi:hypothetical protein